MLFLAERRIEEAIARGELDDLRVGYRILTNAGFVPPEVGAHAKVVARFGR